MTNVTISMKSGNVIGYSSLLQMVTYSQAGPKCQEVAITLIVSTTSKTTADRICLAPGTQKTPHLFKQTPNSVDFKKRILHKIQVITHSHI